MIKHCNYKITVSFLMFISAVKLCYFIDKDNVGLMERIGRKETLF